MASIIGANRKAAKHAACAALSVCISLTGFFVSGCGAGTENTSAGMLAIEDGDYESALSLFSQARDAGEDERLILRGEGIAHMGQSDYGAAIESLSKSLRLNNMLPTDMDYDMNFYLASCYQKNGEPDKAVSIYNAIISIDPVNADAYYERGLVELSQGNADAASADFNKTLSLDSSDYNRAIGIYEALSEAGFQEAGASVLQSMLDRGGRSVSDYDLGRIYYCMGDYDQARESLERAMKRDRNEDTVLALGRVYMANKDYSYAAALFDNYLKETPDSAAVWNEKGICELERGDPDAALQSFQSGLASNEAGELIQTLKFNEICAYERSGDFGTAKDRASEYVALWPDDEVGAREYDFLKTR